MEDLSKKTVKQLREIAKNNGLRKWSRLKKSDLIALIQEDLRGKKSSRSRSKVSRKPRVRRSASSRKPRVSSTETNNVIEELENTLSRDMQAFITTIEERPELANKPKEILAAKETLHKFYEEHTAMVLQHMLRAQIWWLHQFRDAMDGNSKYFERPTVANRAGWRDTPFESTCLYAYTEEWANLVGENEEGLGRYYIRGDDRDDYDNKYRKRHDDYLEFFRKYYKEK